MSTEGILFLHFAGMLLFVGGSVAAAVLRLAAMRRERPSEIALLLRAVRPAVPIVAGGLLLTIAAGFWLAADGDAPSSDLARRLHDPLNLALNASMLVAIVAVVALMVWKPGG